MRKHGRGVRELLHALLASSAGLLQQRQLEASSLSGKEKSEIPSSSCQNLENDFPPTSLLESQKEKFSSSSAFLFFFPYTTNETKPFTQRLLLVLLQLL